MGEVVSLDFLLWCAVIGGCATAVAATLATSVVDGDTVTVAAVASSGDVHAWCVGPGGRMRRLMKNSVSHLLEVCTCHVCLASCVVFAVTDVLLSPHLVTVGC